MGLNSHQVRILANLLSGNQAQFYKALLNNKDAVKAGSPLYNQIAGILDNPKDSKDVLQAIQILKEAQKQQDALFNEGINKRQTIDETARNIKEMQAAEAGANASGLGKFYASTDPQTGAIARGVLGKAALPIAIGTSIAETGLNYNAGRIENKANALAAAMLSRARGAHSGAFGAPERSFTNRGMMTAATNEEAYGKNDALASRTLGKVIGDTGRILTGAAAEGRLIEDSVLNGGSTAAGLDSRRKIANFGMGNNAMGNMRH